VNERTIPRWFRNPGQTEAQEMRKLVTSLLLVVGCASSDIDDLVGESSEALTAPQCAFFAHDGKVTVCHATGSQRHPFQIIETSIESCAGHADHATDYVAVNDPTCNGLGCYPENAPRGTSVDDDRTAARR